MGNELEKPILNSPELDTIDKLNLEAKLLLEGTLDGISQRVKETVKKPWIPVVEGAAYTAMSYGLNALSQSGGEIGTAAKLARGSLYLAAGYGLHGIMAPTIGSMKDTWNNPNHFDKNKETVAKTLGTTVFDYSIMLGTNAGINGLTMANTINLSNIGILSKLDSSALALGKASIVEWGTSRLHMQQQDVTHKEVSVSEIANVAKEWEKSDLLHKSSAYKKLENLVARVKPHNTESVKNQLTTICEENELPFHFVIDDKSKKLFVKEDLIKAEGIDISGYSGKIDWEAIKNAKDPRLAFVIMFGSEGQTVEDNALDSNWKAAKDAGIPRGAYHIFNPNVSIKDNLANFKKHVKLEPGDLPPILDLESNSGGVVYWRSDPPYTPEEQKENARLVIECLNELKKEYGMNPILYTNNNIVESVLGNDPGLADYPLWISEYHPPDYTNSNPPIVPKPFPRITFWQYYDSTQARAKGEVGPFVDGVSGDVDKITFNGTETGLSKLLKR